MFLFKKHKKKGKDSQVPHEPASATFPMITNKFTKNLNDAILTSQSNMLLQDFDDSLAGSTITMLPNYHINPSGQEYGHYLCIDLGGSTLRIAVVDILKPDDESRVAEPNYTEDIGKELEKVSSSNSSDSKLNLTLLNDHTDTSIDTEFDKGLSDPASRIRIVIEKKWTVENNKKIINLDFFKFIASKINEILESQDLIDMTTTIATGITWSFPLKTTSHNTGRIVHVSKGYTIADEIHNQDLKTILESVVHKEHNISIDVKSVSNDLLAVYSAGVFLDSHTKIAMVLGTGFNACCALESESVPSEKQVGGSNSSLKVLFNMELSLFGDQMLPYFCNKYDYIIDPRFEDFQFPYRCFDSTDPAGNLLQPTELMTSGRYLPELTRLVLLDLISEGKLFQGVEYSKITLLQTAYEGFGGELMCVISESDNFDEITIALSKALSTSPSSITPNDVIILKEVVSAIILRAAFIVAISIVSTIKLLKKKSKLDEKLIVISYVGSVLAYFHSYRDEIRRFINDNKFVKDAGITVDFKLIDNSSIIGAAIGAAYFSGKE